MYIRGKVCFITHFREEILHSKRKLHLQLKATREPQAAVAASNNHRS